MYLLIFARADGCSSYYYFSLTQDLEPECLRDFLTFLEIIGRTFRSSLKIHSKILQISCEKKKKIMTVKDFSSLFLFFSLFLMKPKYIPILFSPYF